MDQIPVVWDGAKVVVWCVWYVSVVVAGWCSHTKVKIVHASL